MSRDAIMEKWLKQVAHTDFDDCKYYPIGTGLIKDYPRLIIKKESEATMKQWLKAAGVRCIKTIAQAAIAMIGTSAVLSEIDWKLVISASVVAGILSILTSIAGLPEVEE